MRCFNVNNVWKKAECLEEYKEFNKNDVNTIVTIFAPPGTIDIKTIVLD